RRGSSRGSTSSLRRRAASSCTRTARSFPGDGTSPASPERGREENAARSLTYRDDRRVCRDVERAVVSDGRCALDAALCLHGEEEEAGRRDRVEVTVGGAHVDDAGGVDHGRRNGAERLVRPLL